MVAGGEERLSKMPASDSDWNFETSSIIGNYKGINLAYGMLCDSISPDNEEKEGDTLSGNCLFNLNI